MSLDLSVIYRFVHHPRETFKKFAQSPRLEALIPILVIAVVNTIRVYLISPRESTSSSNLFIISSGGFLYFILVMIIIPLLEAVYVYLLGSRISEVRTGFKSLFTAFIICELPDYLGSFLGSFLNYFYFGLGNLFQFLIDTHAFLYGMLVIITPFYLWKVLLLWVALDVLLKSRRSQRLVLLASMIFLEMLGSGLCVVSAKKFLGLFGSY